MKWSYGVSAMSRLSALTMPAVTDMPIPSGLPTASTGSPTCSLSLSPKRTARSVCGGSTLRSAISMVRAADMTVAGTRAPSSKVTMISYEDSTTCQLVATTPEGSMTNPEPDCVTTCGDWARGEAATTPEPPSCTTFCEVMLTTVGS